MHVDLGAGVAGVGIAISVIDDYISELGRIGKLPSEVHLERTDAASGIVFAVTVLLDTPHFELVVPSAGDPYTRLLLTGTIEARLASAPPDSPPLVTSPLDAKVKLALVLVPDVVDPASGDAPSPVLVVGLEYQGVDGTPLDPVKPEDLDEIFTTGDIAATLAGVHLDLAGPLIVGLNESVFPDPTLRPEPGSWALELVLLPGAPGSGGGQGADQATVDAFACFVDLPGGSPRPALVESFVAERTGLGLAVARSFLDAMLEQGAAAKRDRDVDDAHIDEITLVMVDDAIQVEGDGFREVTALPDVDFTFKGPMVPSLVRGTTAMAFDTSDVKVDVDDSDEIFYSVLGWFLTVLAGALLFTGLASLTLVGIVLWLTAVQEVWNGNADIENAPNTVRDSLATALGASLQKLSEALDDDTDIGELRIDATPDSLVVVSGNMVFLAQILVVPIQAKMVRAEYSKRLRRFGIYELEDGRRFRAQELARLMRAGKVAVPGFHEVNGDYVRANHDDREANNLLTRFRSVAVTETVVANRR